MKIEKISDNQIKVFLNQADLKERNIKLTELAYGSEKTQAFFREMMEQAIEVCGFEIEDTPLMIEAAPASADGIVIIVSKVSDESKVDNKFSLMPPSKEERKFNRCGLKTDGIFDVNDYSNKKYFNDNDEKIIIYAFDTIDDISMVAHKINNAYSGTNSLYRYNEKYFLILQNDNKEDNIETDLLELILSEYGSKYVSNVISKYFLAEHGEVILKSDVIKTFAEYI